MNPEHHGLKMEAKPRYRALRVMLAGLLSVSSPLYAADLITAPDLLLQPEVPANEVPAETQQEESLAETSLDFLAGETVLSAVTVGIASPAARPLTDISRFAQDQIVHHVSIGSTAKSKISEVTLRGVSIDYNAAIQEAPWFVPAGGGFNFADTVDFSVLPEWVFGFKDEVFSGGRAQTNLVLKDESFNVLAEFVLQNVTGEEQVYVIDGSQLQGLTAVKFVEIHVHGIQEQGRFTFNHLPPDTPAGEEIAPDPSLSPADITPVAAAESSYGIELGDVTASTRDITAGLGNIGIIYNTDLQQSIPVPMAGGGLGFFGSVDISGMPELVIGVEGDHDARFELVDEFGERVSYDLVNVQPFAPQFYRISLVDAAARNPQFDFSRLGAVLVVIEGAGKSGNIQVKMQPVVFGSTIVRPDPSLTSADISGAGQGLPRAALALGTLEESTATLTQRGAVVQYNTDAANLPYFAGGGVTFHAPLDLSGLTHWVIGARADHNPMKLEIVDIHGNRAAVSLTLMSPVEQIYAIPVGLLTQLGLDVQNINHVMGIMEGFDYLGTLELYYLPA